MKRTLLIALLLTALPTLHADELAFPKLADAKSVRGELTSADFIHRTGQFRTEKGELMEFTMPPFAVMKVRGAEADLREIPLGIKMTFLMLPDENGRLTRLVTLADLPLGQRYRFHMYQDKSGAFTRCSFISDEHSHLVVQHLTYRVTTIDPKNGDLKVAWRHPDITNYQRDMESPPPFGHSLLRVPPETRVWNAGQQVALTELKPGDRLLVPQYAKNIENWLAVLTVDIDDEPLAHARRGDFMVDQEMRVPNLKAVGRAMRELGKL